MGNLCSLSISTEDTVSRCWDCIVGQASYTCKLEQNLKALNVELEKLKAQRDDVNRTVDLAEQQLVKRLSQVQVWLTRVEAVVAEAEELINDGSQEIQKLCFAGCFSKNCKSSYNFGKQVARKLEEIVNLKGEGVFERVAEKEPAATVDLRPTEPTVGLEPTLAKVWSLLEENNGGIIGLHGLGGVGKTTLLTQINNKFSNMLLGYDVVIWVVVSQDHTVESVQEKIGEKVGLSNEMSKNRSSDEKAVDIFRVLSKKKFVLLLDDVWERVDLIKVGIPAPNQENGCKLIFTTRSLEVCGEMGARKKIKVECLSRDEAWELFEEKVGEETLNSHPDIPELAKQVAAKCGGLPLALITIGRAMACKKMPQDWKYAIEVLKEFPHKLARMDQEVYSLLKFSYDSLPNDTMRSCLLYCCLYPEASIIDKITLIEYWFCEGFLNEFESISRAQLQGYNIINSLLNACLLERCGKNGSCMKLHDVIRDMLLWIARECEAPEKKFFVRAGIGSVKAFDAENWEGLRMSLRNNGIEDLRGTPVYPNLRTLFLNDNRLKVISDGFFQHMFNLKVLNLSFNRDLRELPEGISELVSLECLDLEGTGIIELPIKLNCLSELKCLNLGMTYSLKKIPRQLICSLSKLQVFRIFSFGKFLEEMDGGNVLNGGHEGLIEELRSLQHLNSLSIEIISAFTLENFLSFHKLRGCTGQLHLKELQSKVLNVLSLANMERLDYLAVTGCHGMEEMIVRKIEKELGEGRMIQTSSVFPNTTNNPCFHALNTVFIMYCNELRDLTWLILAPNLTELRVNSCFNLEEIMSEGKLSEVADVVGVSNQNPYAKLEMLELVRLPELKSIYRNALPCPCLTQIMVSYCPKLKKLPLNADSAKGNQISIEGRREWWEEVEWQDEATRNAFLPSFKHIVW